MSKQILKEKIKDGGPYTKKEQEERRLQVFHLHFEEKQPATKIAELLHVNRNTINGDIGFWNLQLAHEFKSQDLTSKIIKQIHRMEIQRDRLFEYFEEVESLDEKLRIEKFISDIDYRLEKLYSNLLRHEEAELVKRVEILEQLAHVAPEKEIQP